MAKDCYLDENPELTAFNADGYTWAKVKLLESAIAEGILEIRSNNRTIVFNSSEQMIRVKKDMQNSLHAQDAVTNCKRRRSRAFSVRVM